MLICNEHETSFKNLGPRIDLNNTILPITLDLLIVEKSKVLIFQHFFQARHEIRDPYSHQLLNLKATITT